ncbi:MAG TPA: N-acetylmuramic acid 6-phosphate etherase [Thermoflexales bacterium]|nr:N-acetylmuramic acid 6-phosphate etherase [Thermoflexales bacterium]HQW36196.1 N-acetylmuramic acid 6-phosphate etherase [Thermoflexales bacterium]HQZ21539.1 N-acetylmuramic acid 6-phosphate etherase [Thermoflexales bacterium]HRA00902.1 N-acetylmuramic acid 6-phosphate etherase [Thermoflexales bacterium]
MSLPLTETRNADTLEIDTLPTLDMLRRINEEDAKIITAVQKETGQIAKVVDEVAQRVALGGRLIYMGAGTSGRLGILDASEMPPTFSVPSGMVIGIIAGGDSAIRKAVEGAEDDVDQGRRDLLALHPTPNDTLVGIAASGRTPYVIGALQTAREMGMLAVSFACTWPAPIHEFADIAIAPQVGPEVITGSTRMKAGTATKLVLNMISTGVMIKLGKTYGNLMVDLQATNSKLKDRARRIVETACGINRDEALTLLARCNGEVKTAIVSHQTGVSADEARALLAQAHGRVREAIANKM